MWSYDKRLQYPVKITNPNPQIAKIVITQLGGPDGELGASMRYLSQRYAMPYKIGKAILTDVGVSVAKLRIKEYPPDSVKRPASHTNRRGISMLSVFIR